MHKNWLFCGVIILASGLSNPGQAVAQGDRRDRREPELIVETGARMGACDALTFTADGRQLLAAGDDKSVRMWPVSAKGLDGDNLRTLRWSIWREQRGAIYALALSPDIGNRHVAVAGYGARTGTVTVLDRATGKVIHSLTDTKGNDRVIWALAFSPNGNQLAYGSSDGSVWLWNLDSRTANNTHRLGKHGGKGSFNRVRLVTFVDDKHFVSVAEDGQVLSWDTTRSDNSATELFKFKSTPLFRVAVSADRKQLAAAGESNRVELFSLDRKASREIMLAAVDLPHSLAFDPKADRLAVGIRTVPQDADFFKEIDDNVRVFDLHPDPPRPVFEAKVSHHAEALSFQPDGKRLACAGGNDHEVALWDLAERNKVSEMRGPGSCLWAVALSVNGRYLGLQDQRDSEAKNPNRRGKGSWRVFDLQRRKWAQAQDLKPLEPMTSAGGWSVRFSLPGRKDAYAWYAVAPDGTSHVLPLDRDRDAMPRCFTFLKPEDGQPIRLAVGHYWGLSLFELTASGVRRSRLCTGHQGEVMALAPSADGKWLVSASRDQTVAAWSLADWPSQPELGARFSVKHGKLLVDAVDVGSPAWEAGLIKDDEVTLLAFAGKEVAGGPERWLERLRRPEPGKEFYFRLKRGMQEKPIETLTTVRQRPLWRFFPTREREWVLWMWRNYYYDTSTNGDFYVGWHVNNRDLDKEPTFYRAEQFRKYFHRPDVIDKLLGTADVEAALRVASNNPIPSRFDEMEPPAVRIELAGRQKDGDVKITLVATPRGDNPDHMPEQVELWINDFRYQTWPAGGQPFRKEVSLPAARLRAGHNELTLQTYNRLGGRADAVAGLDNIQSQARPRLFGLAVGINDYSQAQAAPDGKRYLGNLRTAKSDAEAIRSSWLEQKDKLYENADVILHLDKDANRATVLGALQEIAQRARPDDRLVLFLAGHGDFLVDRNDAAGSAGSSFVFCLPNYDRKLFAETGITSQTLYEALAAIPCRKIVFLDACHSGEAVTNPIRSLTPGGKGPIILAACDRSEYSFEHEKFGHGLFTYAVLEALGKDFQRADRNRDGKLDAAEVLAYAQFRLPELLKDIQRAEDEQNPISFPRKLESYPLAQK